MTDLQRRFYRVYFQSNDGGGAGVDDPDRMLSFGEAFGTNPDGTPWVADEAETDEPEEEEEEEEAPPPDPAQPSETGPEPPAATPPAGETPDQAVERLYGGKYKTVEELEKAHKELTAAWDGRGQQKPEPPPAEPEKAPIRLLRGEVGEIKTEADLYGLAQTDPEAAAMFAMENHEGLNQDQFDTVMNAWIAQQPWKAIQTISAWNAEMIRDEFSERQRVQDEHYVNTMRDQGLDLAIAEQPMLAGYTRELGEYIEQHPQLNTMIEGARTAQELSKSIQAVFYMMAGPQLSQQALTAQVAAKVQAEAKAKADAEAAEATEAAGSINRNTAVPPGGEDDYDEKMRAKILNPRS